MCGIIGYIGKNSVQNTILGLKKLEYRGYDSAGVAWIDKNTINCVKSEGSVKNLDYLFCNDSSAVIAIGHTRWATHGKPSEKNAHPHIVGSYAIVHNGIIENYKELSKDFEMKSDTDSEIIAHLLNSFEGEVLQKIHELKRVLKGKYAIVIMDSKNPDKLYGVKSEAPLLVADTNVGAVLSSDVDGLSGLCKKAVLLEDGDVAEVTNGNVMIYKDDPEEAPFMVDVPDHSDLEKIDGDYMIKEILEQPEVIKKAFDSAGNETFYMGQRTYITACGTSLYAGELVTHLMEDMGHHARVKSASEFRYRPGSVDKRATLIAISQSGETADTIAAAKEAKNRGASVLSIVNKANSSLARMSNNIIEIKAGPEISVASTKAFLGQLASMYKMLQNRGNSNLLSGLESIPDLVSGVISETNREIIKNIAHELFLDCNSAFFIGRGYGYPMAKEGALKLKEISYIHAEAYSAGELKHGPIALVQYGFPVVAIATGKMYNKTISNVLEAKARGAKILLITDKKDVDEQIDYTFKVPAVEDCLQPFLVIPVLQLLAYYTASLKGYNVDKPRNLAKSVTVE